ncbi:glycosyl hydrolase, partial [Streptomyces beijiangensis]|nr:glycosyl hydrolase [Streptomyces beijiangensis]
IDFDAQGNLYLSTGDDSNPFASDGFSPMDQRPGRNPAYDARREEVAVGDGVRRVVVDLDAEDLAAQVVGVAGGAPGTDKTRPEIYAMG